MVQRQEWLILQNQNFILRIFLCTLLYFGLCWVFAAAHGLFLIAASRGYSPVAVHGLLISVASLVKNRLQAQRLSCCELLALGNASVSQALEGAGFSSCGAQAQELWCTGSVASQHVESSQIRYRTHVACINRQIFIYCATRNSKIPFYMLTYPVYGYVKITIH